MGFWYYIIENEKEKKCLMRFIKNMKVRNIADLIIIMQNFYMVG